MKNAELLILSLTKNSSFISFNRTCIDPKCYKMASPVLIVHWVFLFVYTYSYLCAIFMCFIITISVACSHSHFITLMRFPLGVFSTAYNPESSLGLL